MKHAILGAGAIGGLMGTALGYVGEDVTLIVRPEKLQGYPETITLHQPERTITAPAHAVAKLTAPVDVLWIATKTYHLESALDSVAVAPGAVVPLLNGTEHIDLLRARFGNNRVIPATIAVGADRKAEGEFMQGSIVRLNLAASGEPLLGPVIAKLQEQVGFTCSFVANEQTLLWSKLCFLAPFALVTSASGKDKGGIFADPQWKSRLYAAIEEATAVANASGAEVSAATIEKIMQPLPAEMRSSMAKDLIAGRRLELDAIAGPIVRGGEKYGIPTPVTKELMAEIEAKVSATQP
jgi:2-dehydropantoate 2-reductase